MEGRVWGHQIESAYHGTGEAANFRRAALSDTCAECASSHILKFGVRVKVLKGHHRAFLTASHAHSLRVIWDYHSDIMLFECITICSSLAIFCITNLHMNAVMAAAKGVV